MRWTVHGERYVYRSPWMDVGLADVELPDGRRFEHHLLRVRPAAGVVAVDEHDRALLIWRHRFITGRWGWEIPSGRVEEGEEPAETAARELLEETGWRPGPLEHLLDLPTSPGVHDGVQHFYRARGAERLGDPTDVEAERIEWVPLARVPELAARGEIGSAASVATLLYLTSR
ncbi:NUDIX hydrolase [Actinomadura viridis]|uniref:8-oxo-dGTP pyrophosphatase MutT (NUDIX family) n=1 Tax=Actinomadura viridis TaxID=58110 RepID=A0A931DE35_9ACTN|nr:NUDIX hydrolase [Actinomadura viridis]MBG6089384.1 8-oxo-dGTP pyrophosphatase MutT (NUDIX family) [Actinomadura viridis]